MNLLDWLLVGLVLTYALSGYWQGFVTGAMATAGLLLGGLLGVWLAPLALGDANPSVLVSLGALFIVIVCASLGQAFFQYGGARLRDTISWQPFRAVDAAGGAVLSGVAVLLVAWALGVAIAGSGIGGITPLVRESAVLKKVDEVAARRCRRVAQGLQQRRRHDVLPSLPRALRAGADRPRRPRSQADAHRPRRRPRRAVGREDPQHERVWPRHRGLRVPVRPRPRDDQRPRRRGRRPADRRDRRERGRGHGRLLRPRRRRRRARGRVRRDRLAALRVPGRTARRGSRSWATPRTGRTTSSPAACGPSSGCARRTSTATAR